MLRPAAWAIYPFIAASRAMLLDSINQKMLHIYDVKHLINAESKGLFASVMIPIGNPLQA
jgi:hypothetical protein